MGKIDGMAYVKLFQNKACTKEIDKDVNGDYVLDKNKISNNAHNPMSFTFYAKNVGSHKAYDFKVVNGTGSTVEFTIINTKNDLNSFDQAQVILVATIPGGNFNKQINIRVEYDNV